MSDTDVRALGRAAWEPLRAWRPRGAAAPNVLLGVMAVLPARLSRALATLTEQRPADWGVRCVAVLGGSAAAPVVARFEAVDTLVTNVSERADVTELRARGTLNSRLCTWRKLVAFLQFSTLQPERFVARADDDAFVSVPLLAAHAAAAAPLGPAVYLGVFEYYNFAPRTLRAVEFGYNYGIARHYGRLRHNCSAAAASPCQGPFPFAKGPLVLMGRELVGRVVASPFFRRAAAMSEADAARTVHDDVVLGVAVAHVPGTTYVRVRRRAWTDRTLRGAAIDADSRLLAHKLAAPCMRRAAVEARLAALGGDRAMSRRTCVSGVPGIAPPSRRCALEVSLRSGRPAWACNASFARVEVR